MSLVIIIGLVAFALVSCGGSERVVTVAPPRAAKVTVKQAIRETKRCLLLVNVRSREHSGDSLRATWSPGHSGGVTFSEEPWDPREITGILYDEDLKWNQRYHFIYCIAEAIGAIRDGD